MLNKKHHPGRVLVEYNPLWSVDKFYQTDMPRYWDLAQHIVTVDASTFQIYMNNMKSLFMEMIRNADLVIFNRCQMNIRWQISVAVSKLSIPEQKLSLKMKRAKSTIFSRMRCRMI